MPPPILGGISMTDMSNRRRARLCSAALLLAGVLPLSGCATLGSAMSPYSEKFSCKNDDHGQCIHPEKAYEDAAQGRASRSDPAVTHDNALLKTNLRAVARRGPTAADETGRTHVRNPVTNAHLVCDHLLKQKKT